MQKFFNKFLTFALSIAMLSGFLTVYSSALPAVSADTVAAAAAGTSYDGSYYDGITATEGNALLGQLHDLITKTHTKYTSYNSLNTYLYESDPGHDGKGCVEFYTHESMTTGFGSGAGIINKEHVWPKSLSRKSSSDSKLWETSNGGSDMHHIRPTETDLNSARGSKKYGEVTGGTPQYSHTTSGAQSQLGGYANTSTFMPLDDVKGDAARIVMYMYTHYNTYTNVNGTTNGSGGKFGTLEFTYVIAASSETAAQQLLLKWNALDPVDDIERTRNEVACKYQGNRNPFIDHPEYANAIWGDGSITPSDPVTPDSLTLTPSAFSLSAGKTQALTVSATPSDATKTVTWKSDNPEVADVSGGVVTAKAEGTATITATSTLASNVSATAQVTVTAGEIFTPLAEPEEGTYYLGMEVDGTYHYAQSGLVNQYYIQTTTEISEASEYTVSKQGDGWIIKQGDRFLEISIENSHANPKFNSSQTSGKTWTWDTVRKDFIWTDGSDEAFLGNYNGHYDIGGAFIKYFDSDYHALFGKYGPSGGTVTPDPGEDKLTGLEISPSSLNLTVGGKAKLQVTRIPATAVAEELVWTTSDPSVAEVGDDGTVTAKAEGTATVTVACKADPSVKATATVTVGAAGTDPGEDKLQAFRGAVAAIVTEGSPSARLASIRRAFNAYNALTDDEKALAADDFAALQAAVEDYNAFIGSYNEAAENAESGALSGILG